MPGAFLCYGVCVPISNEQTSLLSAAGVGHRFTNIWFAPNGAAQPVSFGGAYVDSVARTGVGTYLVTLTGFSPKALVGAQAYAFDNAAPTDRDSRVGLVTITPSTKTVTLVVYTQSAVGAGVALLDIAANAASVVKIGLVWKVFSGRDGSGL